MGLLLRRARSVSVAALALVCCTFVLASGASSASNRPTISFVSPSVAEGASLTTDSVELAFTYNRKPNATKALVCALSGPTSSTVPCDPPVASGKKGSRAGSSYSGLANGDYAFTVSLTLTDGGTATATRHFSVAVPTRHVYWANLGANTIGRASVDGSGVNQSFIAGVSSPGGVAVDAGHVYWSSFDTGAIGRANLDGTGVDQDFITGASTVRGVAVDAG